MALTTNYSWDKPTVLGDVGAWGTKLNVIFDSVDSQVKTVETSAAAGVAASAVADAKAVVAQGDVLENANSPINVPAAAWAYSATGVGRSIVDFAGVDAGGAGAGGITLLVPVQLPVGLRITGFRFRGASQDANGSVAVSLRKRLFTAVSDTVVNTTTLTNNGAGADVTTTSSVFSEDVVADTEYFFLIVISRSSGLGIHSIRTLQLICTRP